MNKKNENMEQTFGKNKEVGKYFYLYQKSEKVSPSDLRREWNLWCIYNFKEIRHSVEIEQRHGRFLLRISEGNIENALNYLIYLREKGLRMSEETWNNFITTAEMQAQK